MGNCLPVQFHRRRDTSHDNAPLATNAQPTASRRARDRTTSSSSDSSSSSDDGNSQLRRRNNASSSARRLGAPPPYAAALQRHSLQTLPSPSLSQTTQVRRTGPPSTSNSHSQQAQSARRAALLHLLPTSVYTDGGKANEECIICMEELVEGQQVRYLPCLHSYHIDCIDDWLTRKFQCPSCMEPVESGLFTTFTRSIEMSTARLNSVSQSQTPPTKAPVAMTEIQKTTVIPLQSSATDPSTSQCHDNPAQEMDEVDEKKGEQ